MSASSGPEISNNGLVFLYDMANTQKSWKGATTTNLLSNPTAEVNGTTSEFVQYADLAPIFNTYGTGVTYSLSLDLKARIPGSVLVYMQNGSASKYNLISSWVSATTEYQRFVFNGLTASIATPSETAAILAFYGVYGTGVISSIKNVQVEINSFATPFVNGTRSNTQALLDVTGNNILTASNLVYSSTGTFSFNGTSSKITTATLPYQFLTTGFTLSIVLNYTQTTTNDNVISWGGSAFNITGYAWELRIRGSGNVEFSPGIGPGGLGVPTRTSYTPSVALNGRVVFLDITYVANGMASIYENGILRATNNYSGVGTSAATNALTIGQGTDTYFPGTIHQVKLYNTVLTAAEVQQNFNALRGRFGI